MKNVPVIPLCHSGMTVEKLPSPLNTFQSAVATSQQQLELVLPVIAKALNSAVPEVDFSEFVAVVQGYEDLTAKSVELSQEVVIPTTNGLTKQEQDTLRRFSRFFKSPNQTVTFEASYEEYLMRVSSTTIVIASKLLERKGLLEIVNMYSSQRESEQGKAAIRITDEGWLWLGANTDF